MCTLYKLTSILAVAFGLFLQTSSNKVRAAYPPSVYNWEEYLGYYKSDAENIKGFERLGLIIVSPLIPKDYRGNYEALSVSNANHIIIEGSVTDQATDYKFLSATLKKQGSVRLTFRTIEVGRVAYKFTGKFVAVKLYDKEDYALEGTLIKYSEGKVISKAKLRLSPVYYLE